MSKPILQCVPNFSVGCDADVLREIESAIERVPGAKLIDWSADTDHNRSVFTIVGPPDAIRDAVLAAARIAVEQIDMHVHRGVHPRTGAIDVVPVIPLWNASREVAVDTADAIARSLAALDLPVYLYEWSTRAGRNSELPVIRHGGFEALAAIELGGERAPDFGPTHVHPSAGIAIVGARGPLVAYNVDLNTDDVQIARSIARTIRNERDIRPELNGVRALGLYLPTRHTAQVSMNLTRPDQTPLPAVFNYVEAQAARFNVSIDRSEVIGAIPRSVLGGAGPESILWTDFRESQILEQHLRIVTG